MEAEFSACVGTPPPSRIKAQQMLLLSGGMRENQIQYKDGKDRKSRSLHACFPRASSQAPYQLWVEHGYETYSLS